MRPIVAGLMVWTSVSAGALEPRDPPSSLALVNGDFSAGGKGWEQAASAKAHGFTITPGPGRHGPGVTLTSPPSSNATDGGNITQKIDARPWRGKVVSLTGWIRVRRAAFVGLAMRVDTTSLETSYGADTRNRPVPADRKWHEVILPARIPRDADTIVVALTGQGAVDADFDDVALTVRPISKSPPNPVAAAYLDRAIDFIAKTHMNAIGNPDWPSFVVQAHGDAAGAKTPADTYQAIRALLSELHEHHAMLMTTDMQQRSSALAAAHTPTVDLREGRFGVVTLTSISIDDADNLARRYVDIVRDGLARIDASPICGWVVDLRPDSGGSTPVMAGAVAALADFSAKDWPEEYGDSTELPPEMRWMLTLPDQPLRQGGKPVAVLLGPRTGSAGEDTALRFIGRRGSLRSFGARTAGYTSENDTLALSDGALLAVPHGYMHDRTGKHFKQALTPDEITAEPLTAAERWLAQQCR